MSAIKRKKVLRKETPDYDQMRKSFYAVQWVKETSQGLRGCPTLEDHVKGESNLA